MTVFPQIVMRDTPITFFFFRLLLPIDSSHKITHPNATASYPFKQFISLAIAHCKNTTNNSASFRTFYPHKLSHILLLVQNQCFFFFFSCTFHKNRIVFKYCFRSVRVCSIAQRRQKTWPILGLSKNISQIHDICAGNETKPTSSHPNGQSVILVGSDDRVRWKRV